MLHNYELLNVMGSFYKEGSIRFHPHENILYSPVNNRVKQVDLLHNTTSVLRFECRHNITRLAVHPNGHILVAVDNEGFSVIYNLKAHFIIAHFNFKEAVRDIVFSPDGNLLAVAINHGFRIYTAPKFWRSFEPLILLKKYKNRHTQPITAINFSPDSRFLLTCGGEHRVYINNVLPIPEYTAISLDVHKYKILACFFSEDMSYMFSADKGGNLYVWKWVEDYLSEEYQKFKASKKKKIDIQFRRSNGVKKEQKSEVNVEEEENGQEDEDDNDVEVKQEEDGEDNNGTQRTEGMSDFESRVNRGRFILSKKLIISQPGSHVKRVEYLADIGLLATCHSNGKFSVYKLDKEHLDIVHSFSLGEFKISSLSINREGAWIALAVKEIGQLIVWEWRSQSYIFNQTGMVSDSTVATYNPNGSCLATGSHQGKIRLWDRNSGFCFATFEEHQSSVTGIEFSNQTTLFSCSLDGTVNAYDTKKYKKFRTFKPDTTCQLTCMAIQPTGEIICAGAFDPYEVYCWNVQTANMIQIIKGHTAPISSVKFSNEHLITGSWDRHIRVHDFYARKTNVEGLDHESEITAMAVNPARTEVAVATMKGEIYLWEIANSQIIGILDCRKDLASGRVEGSKMAAENDLNTKHLKALQYSSCGQYLLGAGKSKYVLLYDIKHRLLMRRFILTTNRDIEGILDKLNSKFIREGVNTNEIQMASESENDDAHHDYLPGSKKLDQGKRRAKPQIMATAVLLPASDQEFSVCTNFGVLVFCQSRKFAFSPYELLPDLTPELIIKLLNEKQLSSAVTVALKLNVPIRKLLNKIHSDYIPQVVSELSEEHCDLLLEKISNSEIDERGIKWLGALLRRVGKKGTNVSRAALGGLGRLEQVNKLVQDTIALVNVSQVLRLSS